MRVENLSWFVMAGSALLWRGGHYRFGNATGEDSPNVINERNEKKENEQNPLSQPKRKVSIVNFCAF